MLIRANFENLFLIIQFPFQLAMKIPDIPVLIYYQFASITIVLLNKKSRESAAGKYNNFAWGTLCLLRWLDLFVQSTCTCLIRRGIT